MFKSERLDISNHRAQDDCYQIYLKSLFVFKILNILQQWRSNINQIFLGVDKDIEISLGKTF